MHLHLSKAADQAERHKPAARGPKPGTNRAAALASYAEWWSAIRIARAHAGAHAGAHLMPRACGMPPEHSVWAHIPHHAGQSLHAHKQNICAGEPTRLATHATCTLHKSTPAEQRRRTVHRSNASTSSSDASVSSIEIIRARATSRRPRDSARHTSQSATSRSTRRRASAPTRHGAPSAKHTER